MLHEQISKISPTTKRLILRLVVAFGFFSIATIGFISIADEVRDGDTTVLDEAVLLGLNELSRPWVDSVMVFITQLGGVLVLGLATVLAVGYFWYKRRKYAALMVLASMVGAGILNVLLKALFARERPDLWTQLVTETSFSFPSGHAMGSSAFALALIIILWQTKWRILVLILGSLYVLLIGLSRMYLGVHFPTDVVAGWLVSAGWVAIVAAFIVQRIHKKSKTI